MNDKDNDYKVDFSMIILIKYRISPQHFNWKLYELINILIVQS